MAVSSTNHQLNSNIIPSFVQSIMTVNALINNREPIYSLVPRIDNTHFVASFRQKTTAKQVIKIWEERKLLY